MNKKYVGAFVERVYESLYFKGVVKGGCASNSPLPTKDV